jgi:hypothetical protein
MAGGLTATAVREGKRSGQQIGRDGEAAEELKLALAKSGGLATSRSDLHMSVIIHTGNAQSSLISGMRK